MSMTFQKRQKELVGAAMRLHPEALAAVTVVMLPRGWKNARAYSID